MVGTLSMRDGAILSRLFRITQVSQMLYCDWLPERASWSYLISSVQDNVVCSSQRNRKTFTPRMERTYEDGPAHSKDTTSFSKDGPCNSKVASTFSIPKANSYVNKLHSQTFSFQESKNLSKSLPFGHTFI